MRPFSSLVLLFLLAANQHNCQVHAYWDEAEDVVELAEDVVEAAEGLGTGLFVNIAVKTVTGKSVARHISDTIQAVGVPEGIAKQITCGAGVATGNPDYCHLAARHAVKKVLE